MCDFKFFRISLYLSTIIICLDSLISMSVSSSTNLVELLFILIPILCFSFFIDILYNLLIGSVKK